MGNTPSNAQPPAKETSNKTGNKKGCSDEHPVITIFPCEIHGDLAPLICYFFFFFLAAFFLVAMS
ncbi:MAG TPA: hypothetical protein VGQ12_13370 [Candidatus Angelobacter sp.]|jgi:hypothetical protein|nr:hypothetical protein [Candidatus Angelobacter sp.]